MNIKRLIYYVLGTIIAGSFFSIFIMDCFNIYQELNKPFLSPPGILFPIVWTILYILMGISLYLVSKSKNPDKDKSYIIYIVQLFINSIWPLFFFKFRFLLLSFFIIIFLIYLVIKMIIEFYKTNKLSAYLQIPYLLWLLFAAYLNLSVFLLN